MSIAAQIHADRVKQGISMSELADRVGKERTNVQAQLSLKNPKNLTLYVLQEYASALGGEIQYVSAGLKQHLQEDGIPLMQQRYAELGAQLEHLKERLNEKDERIRSMQGGLDLWEQQLLLKDSKISILRDDIERKERIIAAKSDLIEEQYRQIIALQQQIIELKTQSGLCKTGTASYLRRRVELEIDDALTLKMLK